MDFYNHGLLVKTNEFGQGGVLIIQQEQPGGVIRQVSGTIPPGSGGGGYTGLVFHHADHLSGGNVDTNESGNVVQVLEYFPFGEVRVDEAYGEYANDYKFTGKEKDEDTGLYYYEARYYDAGIGRFVSIDPWFGDIADPQSLNKYVYTRNNPLKYIDPMGREFWDFMLSSLFPPAYSDAPTGQPGDINDLTAKRQQSIAEGQQSFENLVKNLAGYDAYTGGVNDIAILFKGKDLYTGEEIGGLGRTITGIFILLPVSSKWLKIFKKGDNISINRVDDATGINLHYDLGHRQNMSGEVYDIAGGNSQKIFKDAHLYAEQYGGAPEDWVKKASKSTYTAPDGTTFQTHWVENRKTGEKVDIKPSNKKVGTTE